MGAQQLNNRNAHSHGCSSDLAISVCSLLTLPVILDNMLDHDGDPAMTLFATRRPAAEMRPAMLPYRCHSSLPLRVHGKEAKGASPHMHSSHCLCQACHLKVFHRRQDGKILLPALHMGIGIEDPSCGKKNSGEGQELQSTGTVLI